MSLACPNCGNELPDSAKFCMKCGTKVAEKQEEKKPRFCLACGVQLPDEAMYCLECGMQVVEDETPWFKKQDEAFEQEIVQNSPLLITGDSGRILDFERNQSAIRKRAEKWAEYNAKRMTAPEWFHLLYISSTDIKALAYSLEPWQEHHYFRYNRPNSHHALVYRTMCEWFINQSVKRGYIDYEGHYSLTVLDYFNITGMYIDDGSMKDFRFNPDFSELDELAGKDDEMVGMIDEKFPPPQPIRVEVAGAILNFTSDDAVVVVYADCTHKGKKIELWGMTSQSFYVSSQNAEIIERSVGDTTICAAIFHPVSFATDEIKNSCQYKDPPQQVKVKLQCYFHTGMTEEEIMLFKGNVTEFDWRGKK